jgi:uncharacterized protein YdiU (UPF0061 family)
MYRKFQKIDGTHPWRDVSPNGYEDYPVRYRKGGRVIFFNYPLAREMGLIPPNHPSKMNAKLEEAILQTFSIQILNEHDWINKKKFPKDGLEDRLYMATRYLQIQHSNKQGKTSGDGRSIWNGLIRTKNMVYDISSRGTGATILSPGAQEAAKPLPTGNGKYGYASGLADLDEMLASAVISEIFYRENIPTERCLAVIEYKNKTAIGVRSAPNLLRPAHIFRYLKTNSWEETKASFDYFLKRQKRNRSINFALRGKQRYSKALDYLAATYAKLAAIMEEEYIFNWLAWDGDNMLASGGILDYGSIRRFAGKHSKYRYEDVDRFSTCLTEQKFWARNLIQTFAQAVDFIVTKEKKNLKNFEEHPSLAVFDQCFQGERQKALLTKMGFTEEQVEKIRQNHQDKIENFRKVLNYFEDLKTSEGEQKVPDGIDHPPVFLIRNIIRELPVFLLKNFKPHIPQDGDASEGIKWSIMPVEEFCRIMAASYVNEKDLALTDNRKLKALEFQELYRALITAVDPAKEEETLKSIVKRSSIINYTYRSTGDGLTWIVNEAIGAKDKMEQQEIQEAIDRFIESQVLIPGKWKPIREEELKGTSMKTRLVKKIQENLEIYKDTI